MCSLSNQTGGWSSAGITLATNRSNETTVTCFSTHLTSFAILAGIQNETQVAMATTIYVYSYIFVLFTLFSHPLMMMMVMMMMICPSLLILDVHYLLHVLSYQLLH